MKDTPSSGGDDGVSSMIGKGVGTVRRPPYPLIVGAFAVLTVAVTAVGILAIAHRAPINVNVESRAWIDAWLVDDARWYASIAADGYSYTPGQQSSIAFFPAYPMTVRGVGWALGGDVRLAGWLVGLLAGLAAVLVFARWVWARLSPSAAATALAVLLLYPYSLFLYGPQMSDSLFLLLAVGAFALLEQRWFWAAGLVGALATAGRPVGVAVAIGLVVRTLELLAEQRSAGGRGTDPRSSAAGPPPAGPGDVRWWPAHPPVRDLLRAVGRVRRREAGVLLSGLGLTGWMVYLWVDYGDPLAFSTVQAAPGWNQGSGPRTWFKVDYVGAVLRQSPDVVARLTAQALMMLIAVLLLRRVWRLFGWGYLAYSVVVLAIPLLGTKDFMGTGRYGLAAFPVIAAAGHVLATTGHRRLRPVVLAACLAGLLTVAFVFATGTSVT